MTYNIKKYNAQNIANEDLQLENQFKNDIFTSESPRTFLEPATINVKNVTLRKEIEKRIQNLMISQTNEILMYSDGERNTVETFDDLEGSNLIDVKPLSDKPYVDTRMVYNCFPNCWMNRSNQF